MERRGRKACYSLHCIGRWFLFENSCDLVDVLCHASSEGSHQPSGLFRSCVGISFLTGVVCFALSWFTIPNARARATWTASSRSSRSSLALRSFALSESSLADRLLRASSTYVDSLEFVPVLRCEAPSICDVDRLVHLRLERMRLAPDHLHPNLRYDSQRIYA